MGMKKLRYKKKNTYKRDNFSKVKHKYKFVVRLKAIEFKEDNFCYLSFYIRLLIFGIYLPAWTSHLIIVTIIALLIIISAQGVGVALLIVYPTEQL